ncbi:MAG TPA: methyltransferase domain-containing protein [Allosphingosinicella sp.]|jgi:SAM-dependent methyltransferase|nr:methyltransferase domain-containing protein [Allosphingosinicella sp.]
MNSPHAIDAKRYIRFPARGPRLTPVRRIMRSALGLLLLPFVLIVASLRGTPGMAVRMRCILLGLRALLRGKWRPAFQLIANPMDSVRYFELAFVRDLALRGKPSAYLDVSSPRLVPLMIVDADEALVADIINPIAGDLAETRSLAEVLRLADRCRTRQTFIEDADYRADSFDLITSISVVEHIPDDSGAIAQMWRLLRPGGRLLLTLPCALAACEEYTNLDEYELFDTGGDGFVYWQRYYDEAALSARIWSVTGPPREMRIYGEKVSGLYDANVLRKRTDPGYPFWWEPLMMARDYRRFDRLDQLPGMGVVAMEFVKPEGPGNG